MTDTQNKFLSRDRAKAFDEIKEMMYGRMKEREEASQTQMFAGNIADEIEFIRSIIDMMERS